MKIKKEYLILILIILAGIIVRIIKFGDPAVGTDVVAFSRLGKNLLENGNYSFGENYNMGVFFPPGYPVFIAIINLFANDLFFSAKSVSFISSVITIPIFYIIGRGLHGEEAGLFSAFAYAVHPVSIILGVYGNSDALFFFFFFLSIYLFLLSLKKESYLYYLLLGISTGIAAITRPEGMFLLILPFLHMFGIFGEKPTVIKKHVIRTFLMSMVIIVLLLPYMLFIKNYTGKFALSGKNNIAVLLAELSHDKEYHDIVNAPKNLYDEGAFTLTSDKTELSGWNRSVQRSLLKDYILRDPMKFMFGYLKKALQEIKIVIKLLLPVIVPLLFLGFERKLFRKGKILIFVLYPVMYFFMYPFFVIIERQTFLVVLFPLILSSIGFGSSRSAITHVAGLRGHGKGGAVRLIERSIKPVIIAALIMSSVTYLTYSSFDKVPHPVEHAKAGYFIQEKFSGEYERFNVMSRKPIVSFYSNARFTMLPYAGSREVLDFAKLYNVDFIAVDERLLSQWDFYDELVNMDRLSDEVQLVFEDKSDKLIKLFRVIK